MNTQVLTAFCSGLHAYQNLQKNYSPKLAIFFLRNAIFHGTQKCLQFAISSWIKYSRAKFAEKNSARDNIDFTHRLHREPTKHSIVRSLKSKL